MTKLKPIALAALFIFCIGQVASAQDSYNCKVLGSITDEETGFVAEVDAENLTVVANAETEVLFGRQEQPANDWDRRPETAPWAISINQQNDGGEDVLILSLRPPTQNSEIAVAYAEVGSKYIGLSWDYMLEAICKKK